jgi:hypothetical protein
MEATARARRTRFGAFEVDLRSGEVRKHGIRLKIQDQPIQEIISAPSAKPMTVFARRWV